MSHGPPAPPAALVETLAEAYHRDYRSRYGGPAWNLLEPGLRDSNRAAAWRIFDHVRSWGFRVVPTSDAEPGLVPTAAMIDDAARREHAGWVAERQDAGWQRGERDDATQRHPDLVPFDELDPTGQEKDRERVALIPALLAEVGLGLAR